MAEKELPNALSQPASKHTASTRQVASPFPPEHTKIRTAKQVPGDVHTNASYCQQTPHRRSFLIDTNAPPLLDMPIDGGGQSQAPLAASSTQLRTSTCGGGNRLNTANPGCSTKHDAASYLPQRSGPQPGATPPQWGGCKPRQLIPAWSTNLASRSEAVHSPLQFSPTDNAHASLLGPCKSAVGVECLSRRISTSSQPPTNSTAGLVLDSSVDLPRLLKCTHPSDSPAAPDSCRRGSQVAATASGGSNSGTDHLRGSGDASGASEHTNLSSTPASSSMPNKRKSTKFSMDEDFPALPHVQTPTTLPTTNAPRADSHAAVTATTSKSSSSSSSSSASSASASSSSPSLSSSSSTAPIPAPSTHPTATASNQATLDTQPPHQTNRARSGTASSEADDSAYPVQLLDNHRITGIPSDMINNQYGMLGLLKLTEIDPSLGVFAPGIDLSRLNLDNWPPPGEMHSSFTSPLADQYTLPPHEAECDVPAEYRIHHRIAGRLPADPPLAKLTDEILFWVFYNLCREEAQLVAAKELYNRDWRYQKKQMRWLTRVSGSEVIREGDKEHGTYYCWDPVQWRKVIQRLTITYAELDDTPTTYNLSSPTLNARVHFISSASDHRHQHRHH